MNLDDIKYGNTTKEQEAKVKEDRAGILKAAMEAGIIEDVLENHPFPANSSDETKNELEYLTKITKEADEEDIKFCYLIENNHYDFFVIVAKKLGLDVSKEEILKWVGDIDPITFYLKDEFNRPRPYQLAKELGLDLHPITATDANSAAYPSGHTMDFLVILYHFGKMKPELAGELDDFYHQIKRARELSGLHYPSDRNHTWTTVIVKTINKLKDKSNRLMLYKDMALMLALFFNPFGFDAVQYSLILLTGSLWRANFVLYCIAACFFGLYIYFTKRLNKFGKSE